jgi:hypothetical protein
LRQLADIFFASVLLGYSVLAILRPVVILRWAKRAHPELPEDDETMWWIPRLIGVVGVGVAGFFLVMIVRSFSS